MMEILQQTLTERLRAIDEQGRLRCLPGPITAVDFCSNDYLGLARNGSFHRQMRQVLEQHDAAISGPTGARLISGDCQLVIESEHYIAAQHGVKSALLLPFGIYGKPRPVFCPASPSGYGNTG